jgi:periplasmic protein TonB
MAPSGVAEHPVKDEVVSPKKIEIIAIESKLAPEPEDHRTIHPAFEFSQAVLLDENHFKTGSRTLRALVSILVHVTVTATPILLGLFFTDTINIRQYASMMLVAPPPPPPPPPAASPVIKAAAHPRFITGGKLFAPTIIPKQVAEIKEEPVEPDSFGGVAGGVPGGVPGGQMGGVMGGVIGGVLGTAAKPLPPTPGKSAPVRVGGRVRPPKAVVQARPEYPPLARQARIQGQVQIDAVLDEQGNVIEMKVVSGPPLLYQSALDALKKWKYEPTYLNDQPIAVQMVVTITFVLGE